MGDEIKREYYSVKEISEAFDVSRVHVMDMANLYKIPWKKSRTLSRNIRGVKYSPISGNLVAREHMWLLYVIIFHRKYRIAHEIIINLIKALRHERNSITTTCTTLLGQSRSGNGEKATQLQQMGISECETKDSIS